MEASSQLFLLSNSLIEEVTGMLSRAVPALSLSLKFGFYNEQHIYKRYYLCSTGSDGKEVFFVTSDEPTKGQFEGWSPDCYDFHLTALDGFDAMIEDLETETFPAYFKSSVHGPPSYVSYDVVFVAEELKPRLLDCLVNEVSGYAEDYLMAHFSKEDLNQIECWKAWLTK